MDTLAFAGTDSKRFVYSDDTNSVIEPAFFFESKNLFFLEISSFTLLFFLAWCSAKRLYDGCTFGAPITSR